MTERLFEPTDTDTRLAFQRSVLEDPAVNTRGASHFKDGDETEAAAARLATYRSGTLRYSALVWIADSGDEGRTAHELADDLNALLYSVMPRLTELKDAGWIEAAEQPRATPSGANATVWVLSERGREAWNRMEGER